MFACYYLGCRQRRTCVNTAAFEFKLTHCSIGSMFALAQEETVAYFCHPPRTGEMGVMDEFGAFQVVIGFNFKYDANNVPPICAISFCVQNLEVKNQMRAIIIGQRVTLWWTI
jgi:hypothetical protein